MLLDGNFKFESLFEFVGFVIKVLFPIVGDIRCYLIFIKLLVYVVYCPLE